MSKFLKIEISKKVFTQVYVEVSDDFPSGRTLSWEKIIKLPLAKIAAETTTKDDWEGLRESFGVECEGHSFVDEKEAKDFVYWNAIEDKKVPWQHPSKTS